MHNSTDMGLGSSLRTLSRKSAIAAVGVGAFVLVSWAVALPGLQAIDPKLGTMRVDSAVCFVLTGLSLLLMQGRHRRRWKRRASMFCSGTVVSLSLLSLVERWSGWPVRVDELLF